MTRSLLAAVSGIQANELYLDEIGDNIANADTVGYKQGTVVFGDLLSEQISGASAPSTGTGGVNPVAIGSGVRVAAVTTDESEGSLEVTGQPTDVAITGAGYLVVDDDGQQEYTRDGALTLDATNQLTTLSGGLVMGWTATGGNVSSDGPLGPITVPKDEAIGATATTTLSLSGNLPADPGTTTTPPTLTYDVYNSLGEPIPVTITFTPVTTGTATDEWAMTVTVKTKKGTVVNLITKQDIFFTATGQLTVTKSGLTAKGGTAVLKLTPTAVAATYTLGKTTTWTLTFPAPGSNGAVTQFAGQQSIEVTGNGSASGSLESYSIGSDGVITGTFSNGQTEAIGQIALAGFSNPEGLENVGNGMFVASPDSGQAQVGAPGTGTLGTLLGGQLEQSNVTLGAQLTDLIAAQEAYQANTKVISATQTAIQSLMEV